MGWYRVNYNAAEHLKWGYDQGCPFVTSPCSPSTWPDWCAESTLPSTPPLTACLPRLGSSPILTLNLTPLPSHLLTLPSSHPHPHSHPRPHSTAFLSPISVVSIPMHTFDHPRSPNPLTIPFSLSPSPPLLLRSLTWPLGGYGCDSESRMKATCNVGVHSSPLPGPYQYFSDPSFGGLDHYMDYCPHYAVSPSLPLPLSYLALPSP